MSSVWLEWEISQKNVYIAIRIAFESQKLKVLGSEVVRKLILQYIGPPFPIRYAGYDGVYVAHASFRFYSTETLCVLPITHFDRPAVPELRVERAIFNAISAIHRLCELQSGELARDAIGRLTINVLERRLRNSFAEQLALGNAFADTAMHKRKRGVIDLHYYGEKPTWSNFLHWSNLDYAESIQHQCETKGPVPYEFVLWKTTVLYAFMQHNDLLSPRIQHDCITNGARFFRLFGSDSLYSMITNVSNGLVRATMYFVQSAQLKSWFLSPKFSDSSPVIPLAPYSIDNWTGDYPSSCFEGAITAAAMLSDVCRYVAPAGMKIALVNVSASQCISAKMKRHRPLELADDK